jgi:probable F420-dependent oxidoreductase
VDLPLVGVGLPIVGPHACPAAIEAVATAADRLGYHSVSVSERLLLPAHPGWTNDFGLPERWSYDAVETLTWVAALTRRVRLRTDVVVLPFQQPVVLARRLATLDHLSGGRVEVGIAQGWLHEEMVATGVAGKGRTAAFEEGIAVLRACWGPDPVAFEGSHFRVPPARIGPKPVQDRIPLHIGAVAPAAVERAARIGDGLTIGFRGWDDTRSQIEWYRSAGGTGPVVVKVAPMPGDPPLFTEATLLDDLASAKASGIDEVIWDPNIVGDPPEQQIAVLEELAPELTAGSG